ncbi:Endoplasmic reticulum resident protein 44 [Hypsibius exemplaris]|uniref:Endoplasmic reticulum resident protein 44 n=1 Tax=Hypsibius exemplaris TaxID=2072580 RepID=A0A1W0W988_HYPEX|nr:Endoplasmic reticulum resident protein 44 [Hypsibius exemplaris]
MSLIDGLDLIFVIACFHPISFRKLPKQIGREVPRRRRMHFSFPSAVVAALISCILVGKHAEASEVLDIGKDNIEAIVAQYDVVFVNFYAEWCKFSRMLAPIFEQTAAKIKADYPQVNRVALGRIDCDKEADTCAAYHISKYPSLKLWRSGQVAKREYRGQRTMDAFVQHLTDQLKDPILPIGSIQENEAVAEKRKKRAVYLHFSSNQVPYWHNVQRMAAYLRDDCPFYVVFGSTGPGTSRPSGDTVVFRELIGSNFNEDVYQGPLDDYNSLNQWIYDRCVPLVREITFENAEELTEEGLPFLILFHKADDLSSVELYKSEIKKQLLGDRNTVNFLVADGEKFSHPLQHLGKSQADLPLIAIDSFRHMYLFPDFKDITTYGKIKTFIDDLHSGKLHRVFHYGFDPNEAAAQPVVIEIGGQVQAGEHVPVQDINAPKKQAGGNSQSPPESSFRKLAPSRNRYTLLQKDEL